MRLPSDSKVSLCLLFGKVTEEAILEFIDQKLEACIEMPNGQDAESALAAAHEAYAEIKAVWECMSELMEQHVLEKQSKSDKVILPWSPLCPIWCMSP